MLMYKILEDSEDITTKIVYEDDIPEEIRNDVINSDVVTIDEKKEKEKKSQRM